MFRVWMASVQQLNIECLAIWHACLAFKHVYKVVAGNFTVYSDRDKNKLVAILLQGQKVKIMLSIQ